MSNIRVGSHWKHHRIWMLILTQYQAIREGNTCDAENCALISSTSELQYTASRTRHTCYQGEYTHWRWENNELEESFDRYHCSASAHQSRRWLWIQRRWISYRAFDEEWDCCCWLPALVHYKRNIDKNTHFSTREVASLKMKSHTMRKGVQRSFTSRSVMK